MAAPHSLLASSRLAKGEPEANVGAERSVLRSNGSWARAMNFLRAPPGAIFRVSFALAPARDMAALATAGAPHPENSPFPRGLKSRPRGSGLRVP